MQRRRFAMHVEVTPDHELLRTRLFPKDTIKILRGEPKQTSKNLGTSLLPMGAYSLHATSKKKLALHDSEEKSKYFI